MANDRIGLAWFKSENESGPVFRDFSDGRSERARAMDDQAPPFAAQSLHFSRTGASPSHSNLVSRLCHSTHL